MKKMMFLACLIFSVTAMTAFAADVEQIKATPNNDMITQLTAMDAGGWVDFLNTVIASEDETLIKRVLSCAQSALNKMDDAVAREIAAAINKDVPQVILQRRLTGRYTISYVPAKVDDEMSVKLKIQEITKGTGGISTGASKF